MQFITNFFRYLQIQAFPSLLHHIDQSVYMDAVWEKKKKPALGTAFMLSGFLLPSVGNGFKIIWHCKHGVDNSSCWNLSLEKILKLLGFGVKKLRLEVEAKL